MELPLMYLRCVILLFVSYTVGAVRSKRGGTSNPSDRNNDVESSGV